MAAADADTRRFSAVQPPFVAVDAMGGDQAPDAVVEGAVNASVAGVQVLLVGDPESLNAQLWNVAEASRPQVVAADAVTGMTDPVRAVIRQPECSVRVAARLVRRKQAQAVYSAGVTGASVIAARLELGRLPGVRRPALAAVLPIAQVTPSGAAAEAVLADVGAGIRRTTRTLHGHALLGLAYAKARGVVSPRVGILNVGAEPERGDAVLRHVHEMLAGLDRFVGNVEPAGLLRGAADVVVTDGFTGNLVLKTLEATLSAVSGEGAPESVTHAAMMLGVNGTMVVGHGAADAAQVTAGIQFAARQGEMAVPLPSADLLNTHGDQ